MIHTRIRRFNTAKTYPEQRLDNDLAQAVAARGTITAAVSDIPPRARTLSDLPSLASVRACTDALLETSEQFDVVIANAGVMAPPKGATANGFETQFGTNDIGHFVLPNRIAGLWFCS